jgi:predicted PurR-regulated permease PerM
MTDYERHLPRVGEGHIPPPPKLSHVLAGVASCIAIVAFIWSVLWGYAAVTYATQNIPQLVTTQSSIANRVSSLEQARDYQKDQNAQIQHQLEIISNKIDRLNDVKEDKRLKEWTR